MKINAVVYTCGLEKYKPYRKAIKDTWGSFFDGLYIMSDANDSEDVIAVPDAKPTIYQDVTKKMVAGLKMALDADWVVVADCDCYVRRDNLQKFLEQAEIAVYGRLINAWRDKTLWYPSGSCFFMPSCMAQAISKMDPMIGPESNDVWTAYHCRNHNYRMMDTGKLQNMEADILCPEWISIHHVSSERIYEIFRGITAHRDP